MPENAQKRAGAHVSPGAGEEPIASQQQPPTTVQSVPAQDPQLTGSTQEEQRRLLKKNLPDSKEDRDGQAVPTEETPAGIHSTGSFSGASRDEKR